LRLKSIGFVTQYSQPTQTCIKRAQSPSNKREILKIY
jgi:hypothetical protein